MFSIFADQVNFCGCRIFANGKMLNLVEIRAQPRRAGKSDTDGEELRIGIAADTENKEK